VNGLTIMWGVLGLLLSSFVATGPRADESPSREVLVYAAASLTDVLQRVGEPCARASDVTVKYSFAGTPTLAKQIEAGAQPDVFVSADEEWMNYVDERGLVDHASRRNLLTNRLVLIAPAASPVNLKLLRGVRLRDALGRQGRLSLADPASVPAGRYAQAALTSLGVWPDVADRIAASENVRAAMLFVSRGEAPLGIVYRTDALAEPRVRVVDEFPADSHPPIVYPAALVKGHDPRAAAFLACLGGEAASAGFRRAGFTPLGLEHAP
jgi:molybdate transport system substrate-binding protein